MCVDEDCYFLDTEQGKAYHGVFQAIRFEHIIVDCCSVKVLEVDRIVPPSECKRRRRRKEGRKEEEEEEER